MTKIQTNTSNMAKLSAITSEKVEYKFGHGTCGDQFIRFTDGYFSRLNTGATWSLVKCHTKQPNLMNTTSFSPKNVKIIRTTVSICLILTLTITF